MDFGFILDLEDADFHKTLESDRAPPKSENHKNTVATTQHDQWCNGDTTQNRCSYPPPQPRHPHPRRDPGLPGALAAGRGRSPPKACPVKEPWRKMRTTAGYMQSPVRFQNGIRAPNLYGGANKVYMIFIQRSAGRSDSIVQQTNNFNQRRKGNLGGQNCSKRA